MSDLRIHLSKSWFCVHSIEVFDNDIEAEAKEAKFIKRVRALVESSEN